MDKRSSQSLIIEKVITFEKSIGRFIMQHWQIQSNVETMNIWAITAHKFNSCNELITIGLEI
jgi:hypothetical protein